MPRPPTTIRALAATLTAALLLAAATSGATARNLSVSNQNVRAVWRELEWVGGATIRCRVTVEGRLHTQTITKSRGTLVGGVTRIDVDTENCTGGRGRTLIQTAHITYEGFTGTLPNINGVILLLSRILFQVILPGLCTGSYGTATDNITGTVAVSAGGEVTTISPIEGRNRATLLSGSGFCPGTGSFRATSDPITLLGTTTSIRLTLI